MYEADITTSETNGDKEIEINLQEANDETSNKANIESDDLTTPELVKQSKKAFKTVEPKNVGELTDDERAVIIANAKNGVDQPNFDVRFFRNGKFRIVRKKEKPPTISEKVVKAQEIPQSVKKAYYTDNQLLFEHIIELNAKVDRLMTKHKKLKRKYQTLQSDIYIDDDELDTEPLVQMRSTVKQTVNDEPINEEAINEEPIKPHTNESINQPTVSSINSIQQMQAQPSTRQNWRSRLRYL